MSRLGNPLEKGIEKRGPNPELLFAGAYSACYPRRLEQRGQKARHTGRGFHGAGVVSLIEDDHGGYRLAVELHAKLPGIDRAQAHASWMKRTQLPVFQSAARRHLVKLMVD